MGGEVGTGENIVFFYRSDSDQKVFFKVEAIPSEGGQNPKPTQPQASVIPITGLPPAESSGTYDLGEAIGETEVGGVYRIGIAPGTDGVVIELPHPGIQEYRQKQIKLSLYRGGTGFGSGKVSLKVRTPDGSAYEAKKLVDNGSKAITEEVVVLPATGKDSGRKVIVELFNDSATTDGAAGGQWVVTTAAEAMEPVLAHQWEGTNLALKKPDGSWGDWVNLQGTQGVRGPEGPQGSAGPQGIPGPEGSQGLLGPKGDRGFTGPQGQRGTQGERGLRGYKGDKGDRGEKGDPGVKGDKGNKGDKGAPGNVTINGGFIECCGGGLEGRLEYVNGAIIDYKHFNLPKKSILYDFDKYDVNCSWCMNYDLEIKLKWYDPEEVKFYNIYAFYNKESLDKPATFLIEPTFRQPEVLNFKGDISLDSFEWNMSELEFNRISSSYSLVTRYQQVLVVRDGSVVRAFDYDKRIKSLYLWEHGKEIDYTTPLTSNQSIIDNMQKYCPDCEDWKDPESKLIFPVVIQGDNTIDLTIYTIK